MLFFQAFCSKNNTQTLDCGGISSLKCSRNTETSLNLSSMAIATFLSFPIFLRFKSYPLQAAMILFTWITMFKPYPTVGELGFILTAFVSWFDMNVIENKLIMGLLVMHSLVLLPVFYHLWITVGSGNSNFFYAMTLVYVIGLALVLLGMIKSLLYKEYITINCDDDNNEDSTSGKKLNLVCV
ncbi:unnamed protein product [Hanseniaspora opuntiae]